MAFYCTDDVMMTIAHHCITVVTDDDMMTISHHCTNDERLTISSLYHCLYYTDDDRMTSCNLQPINHLKILLLSSFMTGFLSLITTDLRLISLSLTSATGRWPP